jgi:2,3-diketo-5-methylthio-1-phosphopentane phosphatase
VYVWGDSWESAKTQAECYHYLFEAAVRMREIKLDPSAVPERIENGIGANRAYGSGNENVDGYGSARTKVVGSAGAPSSSSSSSSSSSLSSSSVAAGGGAAAHHHQPGDACCGGGGNSGASDGFHGSAGTNALAVSDEALAAAAAKASSSPSARLQLPSASSYSHVLLDVEGCTTSMAFVTDTLFPYAAQHTRAWLEANWGTAAAQSDVSALVLGSAEDIASGVAGADLCPVKAEVVVNATTKEEVAAAINAVMANVSWQMSLNRKTGSLKQLQGHVWAAGYEQGTLKGHLFEDTPKAFQEWSSAGKNVYIYSSGSRDAQRLLFKHSVAGDLRPLLSGYFDTKVGAKVDSSSYTQIALTLGVDSPKQVLFATDSLAEATAAAEAGMQVVVTDRPGNLPLKEGQPFPVATSLLQLV